MQTCSVNWETQRPLDDANRMQWGESGLANHCSQPKIHIGFATVTMAACTCSATDEAKIGSGNAEVAPDSARMCEETIKRADPSAACRACRACRPCSYPLISAVC